MESVLNSDDWLSKRMNVSRIHIAVFWVVQFGRQVRTFRWKVPNPSSGQKRHTLNTEAVCSSEKLGRLYQTTRRHIPQDRTLLKSQ